MAALLVEFSALRYQVNPVKRYQVNLVKDLQELAELPLAGRFGYPELTGDKLTPVKILTSSQLGFCGPARFTLTLRVEYREDAPGLVET